MTTDFVGRLERLLKPGGVLHMSTDHLPYLADWRRILAVYPSFREDASAIADIADIQTEFEVQWRAAGKDVPHLAFRLCPAQPPSA